MAEVQRLAVANGALLAAPVYEKHHRGQNWLCVIDVNATMPGGLSRVWLPRGRGECLYSIEQLRLFDPVEFGADYTTSFGDKRRLRWYGVVTAITDGYLLVEKSASGAKAVLRAREARTSSQDRANALRCEKQALMERMQQLDAEIQELESPAEGPPTTSDLSS